MEYNRSKSLLLISFIFFSQVLNLRAQQQTVPATTTRNDEPLRERISINQGWRFFRYPSTTKTDSLIYDVRPEIKVTHGEKAADARPTEAVTVTSTKGTLKSWILPTANDFIKDPANKHVRPAGNPGENFPFVQAAFDDSAWDSVNLPHDWAIKGPFYKGSGTIVGGGMGRLPSQGVAWYRKKLLISQSDAGKSIFLDVDGAMSYAEVWINGKLAGGWPYGYSSWRVDLTPFIIPGATNQLAIRLDNPLSSSRWYPGGGIYRNVWLTKVNPIHVAQWGTIVKTRNVSSSSATIDMSVIVAHPGSNKDRISVSSSIYLLDENGNKTGDPVARIEPDGALKSDRTDTLSGSVILTNPKLWGPLPDQKPNRYVAATTIFLNNKPVDTYETIFGIRDIVFNADKGIFVNGQHVFIKGVNQHHDLGSLGAAFNIDAAKRQLTMLQEMGCNAIRMAHNPPAPELLELTDKMGFLVIDEVFDSWELKKSPWDFSLIFPEWHEPDLRALVRRDRNHPSVFLWSFGNEVGEQYTGEDGAALAQKLHTILKEEDATRPGTVSMNYAKAGMPLPQVVDVIGLNYQGEGIRNGDAYAGLKGISTPPSFPAFHEKFPDKVIISTENAAAISSRGAYFFPVYGGNSSPVKQGYGEDVKHQQVSSYELYSVDFGSSADKVFATMAQHPYVAGGFAWSGWDYLGEPTPFGLSRSSYFGLIDLAGFKKDRYYLYQSVWRPELPMAHILPHWNWPDRIGKKTPVHVFTSGDEAELFLNGKSMGRKTKGKYEYRLRWDDVLYTPGELRVVAYKNGKIWAQDTVTTTDKALGIALSPDKKNIRADGSSLSFITVRVIDKSGLTIPNAKNNLLFSIAGPGEIVATDNGDAANLVSFSSHKREAFNGLCLIVIRSQKDQPGTITVNVTSPGLNAATVQIFSDDK